MDQLLGQHNVPEQQRDDYLRRFQQLQQNGMSNPLSAYQDVMGLMGDLRQHDPNLPSAISPLIERHQGGFAPTAWNVANHWHGMVGNAPGFAQTFGLLGPGLLRATGNVAGAAGPLSLYGLLGGHRQTLTDLRTLFTPPQR